MTLEEKVAIQKIIMTELLQQQDSQPALLLDVLLSGQGYQFVQHVVAKHHGMATSLAQMTAGLMKAIATPQTDEAAA